MAPSATPTSSTSTPAPAEVPSEKLPSEAGAAKKVEEDPDVVIAPPLTGSVVDMEVFGQLLEIDDDDTHDFSKTLAFDYIKQADATFVQIDDALAKKDLIDLSHKGHFLKGSSAALGLQRVQRSCELMQHYGNRKDENGDGPEVDDVTALKRCEKLLVRLRIEQEEAKVWLLDFYRA